MWPIHIIRPHRNQRQLEATPIRTHHHLRRSLARRIRIRRRQYARLAQISRTNRHIAIHLIRRDVHESADAMFPRALQQHMRAIYICVRELVRVAEAEVDVRLRSEVEYRVDFVLAEHALDVGGRGDVAVFECEVWLVVEGARVVERCAVVELVVGDDVVVLGVREDEVPNEPAGSGLY